MHWRQSHQFLSRAPLKIRIKPQKQPLQLFYKKRYSQKFCKFHRKTSVSKSLSNKVAGQETQTQIFSCGVYEVFRAWCLRTTASKTCCFTRSVLILAQIGTWFSLREKCPGPYFPAIGLNTERYEVFSSNAGKYGPGKTPYLETFHAVFCIIISLASYFCITVSLANSHFITNTMEL